MPRMDYAYLKTLTSKEQKIRYLQEFENEMAYREAYDALKNQLSDAVVQISLDGSIQYRDDIQLFYTENNDFKFNDPYRMKYIVHKDKLYYLGLDSVLLLDQNLSILFRRHPNYPELQVFFERLQNQMNLLLL